jgi:hypothetical protein
MFRYDANNGTLRICGTLGWSQSGLVQQVNVATVSMADRTEVELKLVIHFAKKLTHATSLFPTLALFKRSEFYEPPD